MEPVFKEFSLGLEYVVYFICTCIVLISIVLLESSTKVVFLSFVAGLIAVFFCFLACWDLIAAGIKKHRVIGVLFAVFNLVLFLALIFDFIQALG